MTPTPVFSGGTGKSGTTVIGNLIARHRDAYASVPREIRIVTDRAGLLHLCYGPHPPKDGGGRLTRAARKAEPARLREKALLDRFIELMHGQWWERTTPSGEVRGLCRGIERETLDGLVTAFTRDFPDQREDAAREFFFGVIAHQKGYSGQKYWIDTTPKNIENAERITRLAPAARFVYMARDGRDTAVSITKQRWGPDEPFEALRWWADRTARACAGIASIPSSSVITVHLEDLVVRNRESSLERILDFLGLAQTPRVRAYFDERMPADRVEIGKWERSVPDPAAFNAEFERLVAQMTTSGVPASLFTTGTDEFR